MSDLWTHADFDRFALGTRITARTLDACRAVLVEGVPGVEAASQHSLFPGQVSRAVSTLRTKREQMVESAQALQDDAALLKYTAIAVAKKIVGPSLSVREPEPGQCYEGEVIVNTHGFCVQKIGRGAVVHDLGKLDLVPDTAKALAITYPKDGQKALVRDLVVPPAPELER